MSAYPPPPLSPDHLGSGAAYAARAGKLHANLALVRDYCARGVPPRFPVTLRVDPSSTCNEDCPECTFAVVHRRPSPFLPLACFRRLCREAGALGARGLVFTGGGEPTLHPGFPEFIACARACGVQLGLITNLSRRGPAMLEITRSIAQNMTWARVSLLENRFLLGAADNAVAFNLTALFAWREYFQRTTGTDRMDIGFSLLVERHLIPTLLPIIRRAVEFRPDYIQLKPMFLRGAGEGTPWAPDPLLPRYYERVRRPVEEACAVAGVKLVLSHPAALLPAEEAGGTIPLQGTHCHAAHFDVSLFPDPQTPSGFRLAICCEEGKKYHERFSATGGSLAEAWARLQDVIRAVAPRHQCHPVCIHAETNAMLGALQADPAGLSALAGVPLDEAAARHGAFL